jgi:hypothetical protein
MLASGRAPRSHGSNKAFPFENDESDESPRRAPNSEERAGRFDLDEHAYFYNWRGQALTSEQRRERLAAFRANVDLAAGINMAPSADPWMRVAGTRARLPRGADTLPTRQPASPLVEPFQHPGQVIAADVDIPVAAPPSQQLIAVDSTIPVAAAPPPPARPRRRTRWVYVGLATALTALTATTLLGLLRIGPSQAPTYESLVMAPGRAAATAVPLSADSVSSVRSASTASEEPTADPPTAWSAGPSPGVVPESPGRSPGSETGPVGEATQQNIDPSSPHASAPIPLAAGSAAAADGQPGPNVQINRRTDEPKSPARGGRPTPSPSAGVPLTIVPDDTPKF